MANMDTALKANDKEMTQNRGISKLTGTQRFYSNPIILCIKKLSLQEILICSKAHIYLDARILIFWIIMNQLIHQFTNIPFL